MAQTYTPVILGKGVVDTYTGTKGQLVHDAPVIYIECGKCGYVNAIHSASLLKRRAMIPTTAGKLVVKGFYCSRCKAVNSTKDVTTKGLEYYTHIDAPVTQQSTDNGTQPTPSDNTLHITVLTEQLNKLHLDYVTQCDVGAERFRALLVVLDGINRNLAKLVELWSN